MTYKKALVLIVTLLFSGILSAGSQRLVYEQRAKELEVSYNLPTGVLRAIIAVESRWEPQAMGAHGEYGLGQIKPSTVAVFSPNDYKSVVYGPLYKGMQGRRISELQAVLMAVPNCTTVLNDGVFDEYTRMAVICVQQKYKLVQDGIVGPQTWYVLTGRAIEETVYTRLKDPYKNMELTAKHLAYIRLNFGSNDPMLLACGHNGGHAALYCSKDYLKKVASKIEFYKDL